MSRAATGLPTRARLMQAGVWDGRWHLVVGTFDGVTIRLYVDGTEVGSGTPYPGNLGYGLPSSNDLFIGGYPACRTKDFSGAIADVQIWSRALSPAEVSALVQPAPQPSPPDGVLSSPPGLGGDAPVVNQDGGVLPILRMLKVSRSVFPAHASGQRVFVTYEDSQPARVAFTILKLASTGRCVTSARHSRATRAKRCSRYVALGSFTRVNRVGRNRLRLPSRFSLTPGEYVLDATPSERDAVGRPVSIGFTVIRRSTGRSGAHK